MRPVILLFVVAAACSDGAGPPAEVVGDITGQAHAVDNGSLSDLWAIWRPNDASAPDSSRLNAGGFFGIEVTSQATRGELQIGGRGSPAYHPFLYPFDLESLKDVEVVMIPRNWTVRNGEFAGETVPTSLDLVVDDNTNQSFYSYFRGQPIPRNAPELFLLELMTWPEESLPVQVAIDRQNFTYALTAQDSADVWDVLDGMEDVFGLDLFEPAGADPSWWPVPTGPGDPDRVPGVIRIISYRPSWGARPQSGEEPMSWEQDLGAWATEGRFQTFRMDQRYLDSGTLILGAFEPSQLGDGLIPWETVFIHEMLHLLGVGHTCRIESPMGPCARTPGPSRFDVAYIELLRETVRIQWNLGTPLGIMPAIIGERKLLLGQTALPEGTG